MSFCLVETGSLYVFPKTRRANGGGRKCQDHAYLMTPDLVSADEDVSGYEQARRNSVESGVEDRRQILRKRVEAVSNGEGSRAAPGGA